MKSANVFVKPNYSIELFNNIDLFVIKDFLREISLLYPDFNSWLNFTFHQGLKLRERHILVAHNSDEIVGALLLKKTNEEHKICTLYVHPQHRGLRLGNNLMDSALAIFGESKEVNITVSEEKNDELAPLLASNGFHLQRSVADVYRNKKNEYYYKLR